MATDDETTGVVSLSWTASNVYTYPEVDELEIPEADNSQLGVRRNQMRPEWRFPLVKKATFRVPSKALAPIIGDKFPRVDEHGELIRDGEGRILFGNAPEGAVIIVEVTTDGVRHAPLTRDEKEDLQNALRPAASAYGSDLIASPTFAAYAAKMAEQSGLFSTQVGTWLLPLLKSDERLADELIAIGFGKVEEKTNAEEALVFKEDDIRTAPLPVILRIGSEARTREVPDSIMKAVLKLEFLALYRAYPGAEGLSDHPAVATFISKLRGEVIAKNVPATESIDRLLSVPPTKDIVGVQCDIFALIHEATEEEAAVLVPYALAGDKTRAWMSNFGVFLVNFVLPQENNIYDAADFAFTRTLVARKGLLHDSEECIAAQPTKVFDITKEVVEAFRERIKAPDEYEVAIYMSNISYLKSGHHATMFNIDKSLRKMLRAVGITFSNVDARRFVKCAVYYGAHVASTRLSIYKMYRDANTLQLSKAITSRMNPVPPTFAAVCNLQIFITALADARFFDLADKKVQYEEFVVAMRHIRSVMHLAAPYSAYLYGATLPDPIAEKHVALEFAAYAAAIKDVLPSSALILSPSLTNAANLAAANSISATLIVTSYVSAIRRFQRGIINEKLARQAGNRLPAPE